MEESAATEVMADNRSGASAATAAGAAMSYLEELAARIAAKK